MVTTVQKVTFPNSTHSVQHVSILKFSILSTFTKMVNQLITKNYYLWLLHLKITTFGYYISKFYLFAIPSQNLYFNLLYHTTSIQTATSDTIAVSLKLSSHQLIAVLC